MVATLLEDDPETAWAHAQAARDRASRIGVVRETAGIAAYRAEKYTEALRELRAARRITGSEDQIAVIADCERALGRPEKALELVANPPAGLDMATRVELLIVGAGARSDLGDHAAALALLEVNELDADPVSGRDEVRQTRARLMSAYADTLEAMGRTDDAERWLRRAAQADVDNSTGAAERLGLDPGTEIIDLDEYGDDANDEKHGDAEG